MLTTFQEADMFNLINMREAYKVIGPLSLFVQEILLQKWPVGRIPEKARRQVGLHVCLHQSISCSPQGKPYR